MANHLDSNTPFLHQSHQQTVLVTDDDEGVRDVLSALLASYGFQILTATNGVEAVKMVQRRSQIDLVFMDVMMPGLDGIAAYHQIRRINSDIQFVFISGLAEHEVGARFGAGEMPIFLPKPFNRVRLELALSEAMGLPPGRFYKGSPSLVGNRER
jgi:CheY-like chemotaxis protein